MIIFKGILLYEMFHKKAPFRGNDTETVKKNIKRNKIVFRKDINSEIRRITIKMLNMYPKHRPTVSEVLEDPFFTNIRQKILFKKSTQSEECLISNHSEDNSKKIQSYKSKNYSDANFLKIKDGTNSEKLKINKVDTSSTLKENELNSFKKVSKHCYFESEKKKKFRNGKFFKTQKRVKQ